MFRVCCQQSMQHAGAATGQAYDEQRLANFLLRDVGIELPVPFYLQTCAQCLHNIRFKSNLSDEIEPCLVLA